MSSLAIDAAGWLARVPRQPSPNFDARPHEVEIDLVVIHSISLPEGRYGGGQIEALFLNQLDIGAHPSFGPLVDLRVSAHFVIARTGALTQYVSCFDRAWHAGRSCFQTRTACNDFSLGIELEGCDHEPFAGAQYDSLLRLLRTLIKAFPIAAIRGHQHIAPDRKTDPGPHFEWPRLAHAGIAPGLLP